MTNTPFYREHSTVDPGRKKPLNAFDANDGYSGQEYSEARQQDQGAADEADRAMSNPAMKNNCSVFPPDAGKRAQQDSKTGEVLGSGSGTGGGNLGKDYDASSKGGGG